MTEYVKTFECGKCGKLTSGRGHLCHPNKEAVPFVCEFCKKESRNLRHVCVKMLDSIEYVCEKCGRLAPYDSLLCEPKLISGD
ncbi:MAG TPA: hypothetical protein VI914_04320 [Thermodesulfobacteriota bacterium]|nr:hypothetical protein [Thermodesulfobacteriota bacterium]